MRIQFRQVFLVTLATLFCAGAFAGQAGDTPWSYVDSESVAQQPLLLAKGSNKVIYCEAKVGSKKTKIKEKKTKASKLGSKIAKCNSKGSKECRLYDGVSCENTFSDL